MNNTFNVNSDNLFLISILNNMYNDNATQIHNLMESNNQIRTVLTNIHSNNRNRNRNRNSASIRNNYNYSNNYRNNVRDSNVRDSNVRDSNVRGHNVRNTDSNRVFINNRPYIIDNIREYTIPSTWGQTGGVGANRMSSEARRTAIDLNLTNILQTFFDPIEIYPTPSQIENATRSVIYSSILQPNNVSCPISLEPFNDTDIVTQIRYCGHIFNTSEINSWFNSHCKCPVCRYDIRNYNANIIVSSNSNTYSNTPLERTPQNVSTDISNNLNYVSNRNNQNNFVSNIADLFINEFMSPSINGSLDNTRAYNLFSDASNNSSSSLLPLYLSFISPPRRY